MGLAELGEGETLVRKQDRPGGVIVSPSETVPVKPAMLETEIVEEPVLPKGMPKAVGLGVME